MGNHLANPILPLRTGDLRVGTPIPPEGSFWDFTSGTSVESGGSPRGSPLGDPVGVSLWGILLEGSFLLTRCIQSLPGRLDSCTGIRCTWTECLTLHTMALLAFSYKMLPAVSATWPLLYVSRSCASAVAEDGVHCGASSSGYTGVSLL